MLSWRVAFLINVPLVMRGALRDASATCPSRATRRAGAPRLAGLDRHRARRRRHLASGSSAARSSTGTTRPPSRAGHRHRRGRAFPDPDGQAPRPAGPAGAVPPPRVHGHQPLDVPDLRRAVRARTASRACSCRACSATRRSRRLPSGLPVGHPPEPRLDAGGHAGRPDRRRGRSWSSGRSLMAVGAALVARSPGRPASPGRCDPGTRQPAAAGSTRSSTSCRRRCSSASASRWSWRH